MPSDTAAIAALDFAPGGQAILEGVLMRTPHYIAIAVRSPTGEIVYKKDPYSSITTTIKILGLPLIRGMINICEMMMVGFKALNFSANIFLAEPETNTRKTQFQQIIETTWFIITTIIALTVSIALFKFLPLWIATQLDHIFPFVHNNYVIFNLIDGVIKISLVIGYLSLMLLSKEMRRVFQYHGAEHKAVFTYEHKLPLIVANARIQSRFHPRCGTSFILIVLLISIIVYIAIPKYDSILTNLGLRLLFLPVIGGIAYEVLKISAKYINKSRLVRLLVTPGLWLQRITTQEPDDQQLEVALAALETAVQLEKSTN